MAGPSGLLGTSSTPTQKSGTYAPMNPRPSFDRDGSQQAVNGTGVPKPLPSPINARPGAPGTTPGPGSFSANLRGQLPRGGSALDVTTAPGNLERLDADDGRMSEQMLAMLRESLNRELKMREGSENMLEALNTKKAKQGKEQRQRVEAELNSSNAKIKDLKNQISELQRPKQPPTPTRTRMDVLFQSSGPRSPRSVSKSAGSDFEEATESPTFALAEILQALEVEGLAPDYYVGHANNLVELFKRYPTLKYDLVWSIFGLRMQVLLLSESREVVAAGYRMIRYAISDLSSLQRIRALNTDYLVVMYAMCALLTTLC